MGKYTAKYLKTCFVLIALCILFVVWQTNANPEALVLHYLFGGVLLIVGLILGGVLSILSALEDKDKEEDKDTKQQLNG